MTNVGGQIGYVIFVSEMCPRHTLTSHHRYIYGAYLWPISDGPRYGIGFGASAGFALCSIGCAWILRWWIIKDNKAIRERDGEHVNTYGY